MIWWAIGAIRASTHHRPAMLHGVPGGIIGFGCSSVRDDCLVVTRIIDGMYVGETTGLSVRRK